MLMEFQKGQNACKKNDHMKLIVLAGWHRQHLVVASLQFQFQEQITLNHHAPGT